MSPRPANGLKDRSDSVLIDIKPDTTENPIAPKSRGKIPVAILSSLRRRSMHPAKLIFGRTGTEASVAFSSPNPEDVNGDGLADLVCHFYTQTAAFQTGDIQGVLKGEAIAGVAIAGSDAVRIAPLE